MLSDMNLVFLLISLAGMVFFAIKSLFLSDLRLIHKLYAGFCFSLILWQLAVMMMRYVPEGNYEALRILDAITNISVSFAPTLLLLISLAFTMNLKTLGRGHRLLLILACITPLMVFTNPWHKLHYESFANGAVFSVNPNDITFGPFIFVSGAYSYVAMLYATIVMIRFAARDTAYLKQAVLFSLGILTPFVTSVLATLKLVDLSIAATPLAFSATVLCHGVAIFYLNFLDITPIALRQILDNISDGYLILNDKCSAINLNKRFDETFGSLYDIAVGQNLYAAADRFGGTDRVNGLYNLVSSIEACQRTKSVITYEQTVLGEGGKSYYIAEITPLIANDMIGGYVALFKDVTKLREDVRREKVIQKRTMERERLASLGQMIGGIAHNLKTPIMSIAGSVGMLDKLVEEYQTSVGDAEVTAEDHGEIGEEMNAWLRKIGECCSYMSDIINTVKGLATNMNAAGDAEFTLDVVFRRVQLLTQHDLTRGGCKLNFSLEAAAAATIDGDVNNLVQVVNNLVGNAIDAMQPKGGGDIDLDVARGEKAWDITVRDRGTGISPEIRERLFKEMVTSKGTLGTGLGLFISSSIIEGNFGGRLWFEDHPDGGTRFHIEIPVDEILYQTEKEEDDDA